MENETRNLTFWPNATKGTSSSKVFAFPFLVVIIFGVSGNGLVILSILAKWCLLQSNYYFLVFQLAICDLAWLSLIFFDLIHADLKIAEEDTVFNRSILFCFVNNTGSVFATAGICMMLIISFLRYRVAVHPLKAAISRGKLKVICGLGYVVGLTVGYGILFPLCIMNTSGVYIKSRFCYGTFFAYLLPTLFMAVVYCKIYRELAEQNKYLKQLCWANPAIANTTPPFTFRMLRRRYIQNRRTFLICLCTVLCYAIGWLPLALFHTWYISRDSYLRLKHFWVFKFAIILRTAGSYSANPLIYGVLDKKLPKFWKIFGKILKNKSTV